jgi:hypothetical protein
MEKVDNITPLDIKSIYEAIEALNNWGINEKDIITLIQNRISPRPTQKEVKKFLNAIIDIEENIFQKLQFRVL